MSISPDTHYWILVTSTWQTSRMTRFRHMLMLTLVDDATAEDRDRLAACFARMPRVMDFIRRYEHGFDLGNLEGATADFGLVADFDSEEDWRRYSAHPEHQKLVALVQEVGDTMVRMQYHVD